MSKKIERRDFIKISLVAAGGAVGSKAAEETRATPVGGVAARAQSRRTLPLEQLDLGKVQSETSPCPTG